MKTKNPARTAYKLPRSAYIVLTMAFLSNAVVTYILLKYFMY